MLPGPLGQRHRLAGEHGLVDVNDTISLVLRFRQKNIESLESKLKEINWISKMDQNLILMDLNIQANIFKIAETKKGYDWLISHSGPSTNQNQETC